LDDLVSQLPDMEIPEPTKPPVPPTAEAKQPPVSEEEELSLPELPELPELPGEEELLKAEAPKEEPAKPVSEAAPAKEKKPPIKPPRPPSAEKLATKPTDRIIVSVRRIIDYNSDSESGSVMDKLLRRGSDYKLKIPARIILDQIESGEVVLTVDFIYNQVPIELVNFVSAEHGANLRELTLRLPMGDVMEQIAPELLEQSKQKEQEESKWAEDGEKLKEKVVFSEGEPKEGEADREKSQEEKDKEKVEEKIPKDDEKEEKKEAQENKDEEETVKEEKEEK